MCHRAHIVDRLQQHPPKTGKYAKPVNQLSLIYLVKEQPVVKTRHQTPLAQDLVSDLVAEKEGGATRDRTADLLNANQALSQLSYSPVSEYPVPPICTRVLVGLGGFEPPTSPLSGVRSNQLSYRPNLVPLASLALRSVTSPFSLSKRGAL